MPTDHGGLKASAMVVEATFGYRHSTNHWEVIKQFKVNFTRVLSLFRLVITAQDHISLYYLPHCIRLNGMLPGTFSEQVVADQNRGFKKINRY